MSIPDHQNQINALVKEFFGEPKANGNNGNGAHAAPVLAEDDDVIALCRKAKNAAKFASLFDDGDTTGYGSASEADAALISVPAFYTQDSDQLDRIYRRSALMRPKWNRSDYRERTINFVLENLEETYTPPQTGGISLSSSSNSPVHDDDDDNNDDIVWFAELGKPKAREYLIKDVCVKGYPLVAFGAGGVAKSLAMLQAGIAIASANCNEWMGLEILGHGSVLYLDFELDLDEQHRRVRDLCAGMGLVTPRRLAYLSGVGMTTDKAFTRALKFCKEHNPLAVIIDSMGLAMQGDMEHAKDVLAFHARYINPLRRTGTTPLIVDHEGKLQAGEKHRDKSPFGSAFKAWAARSVLQFELDDYDRENAALDIRVRQTKTNFGPKIEPFGLRFTFELEKISTKVVELEDAERAEEESVPGRERVLGVLQSGPATRKEIEDITGLSGGTVRNILSDLTQAGKVGEDGYQGRSKVYCLLSSSSTRAGESDDDDNKKHREVEKLVEEGMSRKAARAEVFGEGA